MAKTKKATSPEEQAVEEKQKADEKLEHTDGRQTTRSDATDMGVPMLLGSPDEPVGPEDALGPGPKRGDYSERVGPAGYQPHQIVPDPDAKEGEPQVKVEPQRPRAAEQGDEEGKKGGVETA